MDDVILDDVIQNDISHPSSDNDEDAPDAPKLAPGARLDLIGRIHGDKVELGSLHHLEARSTS